MFDWLYYYLGFGVFISLVYMDERKQRSNKWHVIIACLIWPMILVIWAEEVLQEEKS